LSPAHNVGKETVEQDDICRCLRDFGALRIIGSLGRSHQQAKDQRSDYALVMQLIEGPTLADRIKAGPIPVDEAVRISRQITDALEYAHERGIIHRELKPANVKVTNDDGVKVLDFGLAKALEGDPSSIDISFCG